MTDTENRRSPLNWLMAVVLLNTLMIFGLAGVYIYNRVHYRNDVKNVVCQLVSQFNSQQLEKQIGCPITPLPPGVVVPTPTETASPSKSPSTQVTNPRPAPLQTPGSSVGPAPVTPPRATVTVPGNPPVVVVPTPTPRPIVSVPTLICVLKICL